MGRAEVEAGNKNTRRVHATQKGQVTRRERETEKLQRAAITYKSRLQQQHRLGPAYTKIVPLV